MKRNLSVILILVACFSAFVGCTIQTKDEVPVSNTEITEDTEDIENTEYLSKNVRSLPATIDINSLDDCTVAVSLKKGDFYIDGDDRAVMNFTVYTYDLYDMVDIATLNENDVIVRLGEEVTVTDIERFDTGLVRVNGGEENGGFELISEENTVYYEIGMSDRKAYYELGKVTLPVSDNFVYSDESVLDEEAFEYCYDDFLSNEEGIEYNFTPYNTSVIIQDGEVIAMKKVYIP